MSKNKLPMVVFHSYPKLLFAWPLLVLGYVLYFLAPGSVNGQASAWLEVLGWAYVAITAFVILAVSVDLERNHSFVWSLILLVLLFVGLWLGRMDVPVFKHFYDWAGRLNIQYERGSALVLSVLLTPPYLVMLLWARVQHKWKITPNEFEHISFGRSDDSLARGAKRVRCTYPDLLELLLCGAGTLIVYSSTGRTELRRIHNVPLLPLKRRAIDRILSATAVLDTDLNKDIESAETEEEEQGESYHEQESGDQGRQDAL